MTDDTRDVIDAAVSDYLRAADMMGGKPRAVGIRRRIIAALDAKGLGICPLVATEAMREEGANAYHDAVEKKRADKKALYERRGKQMPPLAAKAFPDDWLAPVYRAMIAEGGDDTQADAADELMAMVGAAEALREDGEDR